MSLFNTLFADPLSKSSKPTNFFLQCRWWRYAAPLILLCLTFAMLYWDGLAWLVEIWNHNDYSHGYLVPMVSLYIVWEQWKRYQLQPVAPAYVAATFIFLLSLALLLISRSSAFIQLEAASLFLIIPGILLLLFGRQVTRAALLPWLYLSFALPWFDLFLARVQPPFQRISAIMGAKLLSLFYPVFLNDIYIQLPSINMEVAKECSGVNFFISVLAIGIPLVYLTQRRWKWAILILAMGLLITMLANGVRVAMAGMMGQTFGPDLLHGPAHVLQGWFVAWFGWAGLFIVNWIFIKRSKTTEPRLYERWKLRATPNTQGEQRTKISPKPIYAVSCILTLCAIITYFFSPHPVTLPAPLSSLAIKTASWQGSESEWLEKKGLFPGADDQLERQYQSSQTTQPVYLYIAYFNKQTEQKRLIRQLSLPLHKKAVTITLPGSESGLSPRKINRTTLIQNGIKYNAFFWYQFPNGKTVTGQNQARLAALFNGLLEQRNNGAIILVGIRQNSENSPIPTEIPPSISLFLQETDSEISNLIP